MGSENQKQKLDQLFQTGDPKEFIPSEKQNVIYSGPVVFRYRGQYLGELYNRFGPPAGPVIKSARCWCTYALEHAEISAETLFWLSTVENKGIRIQGPQRALSAVTEHIDAIHNVHA